MGVRSVVVTGVAGGIGRAVAARFLADGCLVAGLDVIDPAMAGVSFHRADVTVTEQVAAAMAEVVTATGTVDVLVTCAGVTAGAPLHETADDDWRAVLDANLTSVFLSVRAVLPAMIASGGGAVVAVGSVLHRTAAPGLPAYAAAKAAVAGLLRQLTVDYGRYGISFVTVSPGWVRTPATESRLRDDTDLDRLRHSTPVRVLGSPAHVANTVAYAASADALMISGNEIVLDAGASVVNPASLLREGHRERMNLPPLR